MKSIVLGMMLLLGSAALAAPSAATTKVFSNIDDNTALDNGTVGWGWCDGSCAGGTTANNYWMAQNQTTPARDGASTEFYVDGQPWSDVLFWYKLGAYNSFTHFQTDFWIQVDQNSTLIGQALEFDTFQFVKGREYMFGTQCDYGAGYVWDIWSQGKGQWIPTTIPCDLVAPAQLTPNVWYHISWTVHRTSDRQEHYDSVSVVRYDSNMNVVSSVTRSVNIAEASGPLPSGWNDDMGTQFQIDLNGNAGIGSNPTTITEHVDQVTVTAW